LENQDFHKPGSYALDAWLEDRLPLVDISKRGKQQSIHTSMGLAMVLNIM